MDKVFIIYDCQEAGENDPAVVVCDSEASRDAWLRHNGYTGVDDPEIHGLYHIVEKELYH